MWSCENNNHNVTSLKIVLEDALVLSRIRATDERVLVSKYTKDLMQVNWHQSYISYNTRESH